MTENNEKFSFNLVTQDWIPCRMLSETLFRMEMKSLSGVLLDAHNIREIVGDAPPVTIALYRLLLAILHRSLGPMPCNDFQRDWETTWKRGKWSEEEELRIRAYLEKWDKKERFDLFHETHPFYQSTLGSNVGEEEFSAKLFFQADSNSALFEHATIQNPPELPPAEASRWLVAYQAFDFGGTKSGKDDQKHAQPAPLIQSAVGLAFGASLFETLMLNLFWDDDPFFTNFKDQEQDKPAWERDDPTTWIMRRPEGYLDWLTWQCRCVRLKPERNSAGDTIVRRASAMSGFKLPKDWERNGKEVMIGFIKSRNADADKGFVQIGFTPGRALWRDSHALFHTVADHQMKPLIIDWLADLSYQKAIDDSRIIPIDFYGLTNERGKFAKLLFWRQERLPLPLHYLRNDDLCEQLKKALGFTEVVGKVLAGSVHRFAALFFITNNVTFYKNSEASWFKPLLRNDDRGKAEKDQRKIEKETHRDKDILKWRKESALEIRYWPRMDAAFHSLIIALAKEPGNWSEHRKNWAKSVETAALQSFREVVSSAGNSTRSLRASAIAEEWFGAEFNFRKKRYLDNQIVTDTVENENVDEEERSDE